MPTRIIREGILTSEPINALSERAELFYRRLMSVADDHGRFFAAIPILRAYCYPLRLHSVRESDVKQLLSECVSAGLIGLYGGGKYITIKKFGQQTRSKSKFPDPELLSNCEADANQMSSLVGVGVEVEVEGGVGAGRFAPPTLEAVKLQAAKIGLPDLEADKFFNYYESKGWIVGKSKMKSWPHALTNWRANCQKFDTSQQGQPSQQDWRNMSEKEIIRHAIG